MTRIIFVLCALLLSVVVKADIVPIEEDHVKAACEYQVASGSKISSHFWVVYLDSQDVLRSHEEILSSTHLQVDVAHSVRPLNFPKEALEAFPVLQRMANSAEVDLTQAHRADGYAIFPEKTSKVGNIILRFYDANGNLLGRSGYFGFHTKCLEN